MWWLAWLIAAVALGVAEAFSLTLAFGIFSAAALLAAVVAGFGAACKHRPARACDVFDTRPANKGCATHALVCRTH